MKKTLSVLLVGVFLQMYFTGWSQTKEVQNSIEPIYQDIIPAIDSNLLMQISIPNTIINSVTIDQKTNSCNIVAIVNHPPANDSVLVWIALPLKNWNGRFLGTGGGGFMGGMPMFEEYLAQGFAVGATNTGHDGGSGSFALNSEKQLNWQLIQDNAYLGIHDMTVVGKELVRAYYGKSAKYAYFLGGSTGGRQGLSEAQRYPEDYDGIVSFYPAINWHCFLIAELWPQVVMYELDNYISAGKFQSINQAIINEVDAKDGFTDGVIENALDLKFDLNTLIGKNFNGSIITVKDVEVIKRIWEGPRTKEGQFLWYGLLPGTDFTALSGTKGEPLGGNPFPISVEWVRYFLRSDPDWQGTPITHSEFQLLWNQSVEQYGNVFGTDNPNLKDFKENGGKLLIIHGLNDRLIFPQGSINYYQRVKESMGGAKETYDFTRLFLIPGLDHNHQDPALKPINYFESLIQWVEKNVPTESIKVEHSDKSGNITRTAFYDYIK